MNGIELLSRWPGMQEMRPEEILASEAWAMRSHWGDEEVVVRRTENRPRDVIALKIALDDEEHFLGIGERETFPDLAVLWERKQDLPGALVLALVEKECGKLLQLLENTIRRQLRILGLASLEEREGSIGFEVVNAKGKILASFALPLSSMVVEAYGDFGAIDIRHPIIRGMTRPVGVEYATFTLGDEATTLAPGDYILAPELDNPLAARWSIGAPRDDGKYHLRATDTVEVPFAAFADEVLPEIPKPECLELFHGAKRIAVGRRAQLGEQCAFAVEEVL